MKEAKTRAHAAFPRSVQCKPRIGILDAMTPEPTTWAACLMQSRGVALAGDFKRLPRRSDCIGSSGI